MKKTTFEKWIDGPPTRHTALAEHLGITTSAVSQWRTSGVPMRHMPKIARFSGIALETLIVEAAKAKIGRKPASPARMKAKA